MPLLIQPVDYLKCDGCNSITEVNTKELEYADGNGHPLCPVCGSMETNWDTPDRGGLATTGLSIAPLDSGRMKNESFDVVEAASHVLASVASALLVAAIWAFFIAWIFDLGFMGVMKVTSAGSISIMVLLYLVGFAKRKRKN